MERTFFYTQINPNDFNMLKDSCRPFTKDIFTANQEHIVAFEKTSEACKCALSFLNQIMHQHPQHQYKIVLISGPFQEERPDDLALRVARSIHQQSKQKGVYLTGEILQTIHSSDIEFEDKSPLFVKPAQKEIPLSMLTRFEETQLQIDPTDLFDFSHVDSYTSVPPMQSVTTGDPAKAPPKSIFESSNTTIEIDPVRKKVKEQQSLRTPSNKVNVTTPKIGVTTPKIPTQGTSNKPSLTKSVTIIGVVLTLVIVAGFFMSKSNSPTMESDDQVVNADKPLPIVDTPTVESVQTAQAPQEEPVAKPETEVKSEKPATSVLGLHEALLSVHTTPKGAKVWINGKEQKQVTPIESIKVSSMKLTKVEVSKSGYQKASKKLELKPQETRVTTFQLISNAKPKSKKKTTTTTKSKKKS